MTALPPVLVRSRPGVKRDGTPLDGDFYTDALWCRMDRGLPRKMGGFKQLSTQLSGFGRGLDVFPDGSLLRVHVGSQDKLELLQVDPTSFLASGVTDRTPVGFSSDDNNTWQFAQLYDATSAATVLIAHASPDALNLEDATETDIYTGEIADTAVLTDAPSLQVSGGVCVLHPYVFAFGNDGYVANSVANKADDFVGTGSNSARVTSKKVVAGLPLRGGASNTPAGLFWSLDSLIRASYVGGTAIFSYDAVSSQSGILGARTPIEVDGTFYWIGLGRFMQYNGVVQELPNDLNRDWFFNNLNWAYRNKTFSFSVPRFDEIWWCAPLFGNTEPSHAVIYNRALRTWYDTALPNGGRTCGGSPVFYRYPFLTGAVQDDSSKSLLWQHEVGVDEVSGTPSTTKAVRSYFETHDLSLVTGTLGARADRSVAASLLEPDFVQTGGMTVIVRGRSTSKAANVDSPAQIFTADATTVAEQIVRFKGEVQRRELRLKFESNVAGGDYQLGATLVHLKPGDGRISGGTP